MKFSYTAGAILLATVHALPSNSRTTYSVFEHVKQIPHGYKEISSAPASGNIKLNIHLEQKNTALFEQHLYRISDPEHPTYGDHMTQETIDALMAPDAEAAVAVKQWLASFGVTPEKETSDSITVVVPISKAETMLQTKYKQYEDLESRTGRKIMRTTEYSLPESLHDKVAFVQPTTMFGLRNQAVSAVVQKDAAAFRHPPPGYTPISTSAADLQGSCNTTITPSCIQYLYNFAGVTPVDNSQIGIQGFLGQAAQYADLEIFLSEFAPQHNGSSFDVVSINGGTNVQNASAGFVGNIEEANLDIQYTVSLTSPIKNTFFSTAGMPPWISEPDDDPDQNVSHVYRCCCTQKANIWK